MTGAVKKLISRRILHYLAAVHNGNIIAQIADHIQVMGDEQIT